jgi:hypothetical protein
MANTQGGLIIVGVTEDNDAQLTGLPGVPLSDCEHTRLLSLIGDHVHRYAAFEIIPVPDPSRQGIGCYVIAIPRSPRFPHGVLINTSRQVIMNGPSYRPNKRPKNGTNKTETRPIN